ncbi:MAG: amino-acid N-acetyltransferase [gamma proteobacterium symbiont of Bathyaustriella thionipta]|nr:amino-acid N-acetyltransferase [gamma proteobacterium symbiont of Bathyaustriella thionipta]
MNQPENSTDPFVSWLRNSTPYVHAHRNKTFVISFGGEALAEPNFPALIHDLALLQGLGIRLIIAYGARPQISQRLTQAGIQLSYQNGIRITDDKAMQCVKEANGVVRIDMEALFSLGLANSPMAGAQIRVASGNFVTARPIGIRNGVDYRHTGEVRRIDAQGIRQQLDNRNIVLLPAMGYSPTGEVFNLSAADVACATAIALEADKLIILHEGEPLSQQGQTLSSIQPRELDKLLQQQEALPEDFCLYLQGALRACRNGVARSHIVPRQQDGVLLRELFTRDGCGTLLSAELYEDIRRANINDAGGILELIKPLEDSGVLLKRSREKLETEIACFSVIERDSSIIGCAALYPYADEGKAELACVAIHADYQGTGRGDQLLSHLQQQAIAAGIQYLFVLTTQSSHWFLERGFQLSGRDFLPESKLELYNLQRNSQVLYKSLS